MLWQSSSQKQPHVLQTSQELQGALAPQKVFNPEDRYEIWKQDWASVSKASRFLRALSHPGLASRTAGESQREPPSGWQVRSPGCCGWLWMPPQGCTCVSISQAPSWPRVSAAEIVRALAVHFHTGAAGPSLYLFASPSFPWYGMKHSRHWEV